MAERALCGAVDAAFLTEALTQVEQRRSGHIAISDGVREVVCLFSRRGVRVIASGHAIPALGDWLLDAGVVSHERLGDADRSSREALVRAGVSSEDLEAAVRGVVIEVLADTLLWPGAAGVAGRGDLEVRLPEGAVVFEDDLRFAGLAAGNAFGVRLPGDVAPTGLRLVTTRDGDARRYAAAEHSAAARLLSAILERPGARGSEALAALGWGESRLARALAILQEEGLVDPQVSEAADPAARAESGEQTLAEATCRIARRLGLSRAWAAAKDAERAAGHEARAGWLLVDAGRADAALVCFDRAAGLSPGHLEGTTGQLFVRWQRGGAGGDALRDLARKLTAAGLPRQAQRWLALLLKTGEDVESLQALREALSSAGDVEGARQVASRVVELLEASGRHAEAQDERVHIQEASGSGLKVSGDERGLRRATLVALALTPLLAVAAFFVHEDLLAQRAYAAVSQRAKERLARGESVREVRDALFPEGEARGAARALRERLTLYLDDDDRARSLRNTLQIYGERNIDVVIKRLEGSEPAAQTEALRRPLDDLLRRLRARRQEAVESLVGLNGLSTRPFEAFNRAKRLMETYRDCPRVLARASVSVRLESKPMGARVRWRGVDLGRGTPLAVTLPLHGTRKVELTAKGYMPLKAELELKDLSTPRVVLELGKATDPEAIR